MPIVLLILFLAVSGAGVVWGVFRQERYFQFPTVFSATWLLYLGPQAIGSVVNKHKYPHALHRDGGLEIALAFCILCVVAGYGGYTVWLRSKRQLWACHSYSSKGIFLGGVCVYLVGLWGAYELAQLCGGFRAQFTEGGFYSTEWVGAPVMYTFFARLIYPGFLLMLLATLHRPSIGKWLGCLGTSLYPLAVAVFLGRRSLTALLAIMVLLSVFMVRRWAVPRPLFIAALLFAMVGAILGAEYRRRAQDGITVAELKEIDAASALAAVVSGEGYAEFDMVVYGCAAVQRNRSFDYGIGLYNAIIGVWVPRQIVGAKSKNSLMLPIPRDSYDRAIPKYYDGWTIPYGTNHTGPLTAFAHFGFLGCLIYFSMGYIYHALWNAAYGQRNIAAQIWYVASLLYVPEAVYGSVNYILPDLLKLCILVGPVLYWARVRPFHSQRYMRGPSVVRAEPRPLDAHDGRRYP